MRSPKGWLSVSLHAYAASFLSPEDLQWSPCFVQREHLVSWGLMKGFCLAWHALLQGHQSQARSTGHRRPAPLCQVTQVDIKPGPHLSKVLSKTCLWGPRSGHKTQVTVNTNIDGHVTIRVRAGCEGLSILWSEPFPRNFQEWKGLWARARRNSSYYQPNH